jgi:hypothetical protein
MNSTAIWRQELYFYLINVMTSVAHLTSMERSETEKEWKLYNWKYAKFPNSSFIMLYHHWTLHPLTANINVSSVKEHEFLLNNITKFVWYLRFPQWWLWRTPPSVIWHHVVWYKLTDFSEKRTYCLSTLPLHLPLAWLTLRLWSQYVLCNVGKLLPDCTTSQPRRYCNKFAQCKNCGTGRDGRC